MTPDEWIWITNVLSASGEPWPEGVVRADYQWLKSRPKCPGRRRLAERWGWTVHHAGKIVDKAPPRQPTLDTRAIWRGMWRRCTSQKCADFPNYGGRGIRVDERWRDHETFARDMGPRPTPEHTLDRVDNDGDYTPSNCRWATRKEQSLNKRNTVMVALGSSVVPVVTFAEWLGVRPSVVMSRLRSGKSPTEILREFQ